MSQAPTIEFQFLEARNSWPICIAKVEGYVFICLECYPFISGYANECGNLMQQWFSSLSYPISWEIVHEDNYFTLKNFIAEARKEAEIESLPF